jgi:hypothetical protein
VEPEVYVPALVRHLHLAPLRAHLAVRADGYPWSSARAYDSAEETPGLARGHVLNCFGEGDSARQAFGRFTRLGEDGPLDRGLEEGLERGKLRGPGTRLVFGSDEFAESQIARASQAKKAARGAAEHAPGLAHIIALVCREQDLEPTSLALPSRNRKASYARALVAYLADELGSAALAETARHFKRDLSGISRARARIAQEVKKDPSLARKLADFRDRLTGETGD